jgi:hypothetical protein
MVIGGFRYLDQGDNGVSRADNQRLFRAGDPDLEVIDARTRFGIVLLSLLCATVIGGVGYWSSLPQYVELASGLEPTEFSDIVTELDRAGIFLDEMKGAGNTLFVDRRYWSQAQGILRQKGPVSAENTGAAADGIGMFPLPEEAKMRRFVVWSELSRRH